MRFMLAGYRPAGQPVDASALEGAATSQPTTRPVGKSRRRAKRRMVVRAVAVAGGGKTEVVLTQEDVDRIRRSPEGASALRQAQVVIVVNSAAAGTEGRLWLGQESAVCVNVERVKPLAKTTTTTTATKTFYHKGTKTRRKTETK